MLTKAPYVQRTLTQELNRGSRVFLHFDPPFEFEGDIGKTRSKMCPFLKLLRKRLTLENGVYRMEVLGNWLIIYPTSAVAYTYTVLPLLEEALSVNGYINKLSPVS